MLEQMNLWSSWQRLIEICASAVLFYVFIIAIVRILGKRATSELNNFDWIVNVAVGSLAASGILLDRVATLDAMAAIAVVAACQYFTTQWVQKTKLGSRVIKARPTLLTHKGEYLTEAMKKARVSKEEVRAALRQAGHTENEAANWVILETNGTMSVIPGQDVKLDKAEALKGVQVPAKLRNADAG